VLVAREVARLASVGSADATGAPLDVSVTGDDSTEAAMAPDALKQVLLNLLQNSRDAGTGNGPTRIGIVVGFADAHVSVDVFDDGSGIPEDIVHRVFDPFFTTKGAVHGVGLGLFVAEGLVRTAGGSISARNARARSGTTYRGAWFHIELPAPNDSVAERAAPDPTATRASVA
jgi:two-component system C4-dicarboxylate transport sensor histidine kinase DctB